MAVYVRRGVQTRRRSGAEAGKVVERGAAQPQTGLRNVNGAKHADRERGGPAPGRPTDRLGERHREKHRERPRERHRGRERGIERSIERGVERSIGRGIWRGMGRGIEDA